LANYSFLFFFYLLTNPGFYKIILTKNLIKHDGRGRGDGSDGGGGGGNEERELMIVMVNGEDEEVMVVKLELRVVKDDDKEVVVVKLEFRVGFQIRSLGVDWNGDGNGDEIGEEVKVMGMVSYISNIVSGFQIPDI